MQTTPLLNPATPVKQLDNESHIKTNVAERLFGVLKRRFPILTYSCHILEQLIRDGQIPGVNNDDVKEVVERRRILINDYFQRRV
jgi:hypothetical protein